MNEIQLKQAIRQSLSGIDFPDARKQQVLGQIKGEKPMKRKLSLALVCAIALTLLLMGTALAAVLGLFSKLDDSPRMRKLDEYADVHNIITTLEAPEARVTIEPQTTYDMLLSRQYERSFELILNQTYFDGQKLYYSYTLKTDAAQSWQGAGMPTGIAEWLMEESGRRYEDVWANDIPGRDEAIQSWLGSHESSWIAHENWNLGDGATTADGVYLPIVGSDSQRIDEYTLQGYQEVALPEALIGSDSLDIELTVLYGATLYHQDESGVRCAHIAQPENRGILRIPFTVSRNGQAVKRSGSAAFADYSAKADLSLSDVEITGKVTLTVPAEWTDTLTARIEGEHDGDVIFDYQLMADGETLRNTNCSLHIPEPGKLEITVQYELPENAADLKLIPVYAKAGTAPDECIPLPSAT